MSQPSNLGVKKAVRPLSVQPKVRSDYSAVTATTTVSILVRENLARKEVLLTNTSPATLYVAFSRLPSTTDYTVAIPANGVFVTASTDRLNGVWAAASGGQANITEEY